MNLRLTGERLTIDEWKREELADALAIYNSNPRFNEWSHGVPQLTLADLEREYEENLQLPTGHWLALRVDVQLIGVAHLLLHNPNDGKCWIGLLLIHADWQGRGIGGEFVNLVEAYVRSAGHPTIHTGVIAHNEPALRFWGAMGYEQYRQVTAPVGRLTQPVLLLAKFL